MQVAVGISLKGASSQHHSVFTGLTGTRRQIHLRPVPAHGGLVDARVVHDRHLAVEDGAALLRAAVGESDGDVRVAPHARAVPVHGHPDGDVLHGRSGVRLWLAAVARRRFHGDTLFL